MTRLLRSRIAAPALASLLTTGIAAAAPQGEPISVDVRGSYIESIDSAGQTVDHTDLEPGVSAGANLDHIWGATVRTADGRNLESYFVRNGTSGPWIVDLREGWQPSGGVAADFFLFEVGGNDGVVVRPRLVNGEVGAPTTLDQQAWSATDVVVDGGPNAGQRVHGMGFRFEDLRRASGAPLGSGDMIGQIIIESGGVDGASFLVRDPGHSSTANGDGSWFATPEVLRALSPVQVTFRGPWASETGLAPNPFLDYRLDVRFVGPGGRTFVSAGFFNGDGENGDHGNLWSARFLPPVPGTWTATASMRVGPGVAISTDPLAGTALAPVNGVVAVLEVLPTSNDAGGFFTTGTLLDAGKHHRRFEFGNYFLKAGTNGPENFLALRAVDDITKSGGEGNLHSFEPHVADWNPGDPIIDPLNRADDGRGVIGALNYLAEEGVNSLFLMMMNLGGDGNDVYPFLGPKRRSFEKLHYDTSRLRQWNVILEHAQRKGISLSLVLNETEIDNELWLDGGNLGPERRLFYREMVARFGHLPAVRWNVCEENDFSIGQLDGFASLIKELDCDEHAVSIHNNPNDLALFQSLASNPNFDAASLQFDADQADAQVEQVRRWTSQAGKPWLVDADEMGPWQIGLTDQNAVDTRKRILYDALFSGGGIEFYFGWHSLPLGGDLSLEDFRTRDEMWNYTRHARMFMERNLPFWDMQPMDELVNFENPSFGGAEVYALPGEVYAVYYPNAQAQGLFNFQNHTQNFQLTWYDPRTGEFAGPVHDLGTGGGWRSLPDPPYDISNDWVGLIRERAPLAASASTVSVAAAETQVFSIDAGPSFAGRDYVFLSTASGTGGSFNLSNLEVPIVFDRLTRFAIGDTVGQIYSGNFGTLDAQGRGTVTMRITPVDGGGLAGTTLHHCVITRDPYDWVSNTVQVQIVP